MKTILVIEDDKVLKENTKELLELANYKVITAEDGKEGAKMAINFMPDLILCDILMPVWNGYKVLEYLEKQTTHNIPFIFFSAKSEIADIRKGMNLGADDYITKPFKEEDLLDAIKSRLAKFELFKGFSPETVTNSSLPKMTISTLEELKNLIKSQGERIEFYKKKEIFSELESAKYIYLLEEGIVKSTKIDEDGKELIMDFYKEGDLFGLYSFTKSAFYRESAIAVEDGIGFKFSTSSLHDIINHNLQLTLELTDLLNNNLSNLREHLLEMAYGSVLKKTSHTIVLFAEKIQKDPSDLIKIKRSDLANAAGISTESFIRSLALLKKKKLIDIEGRNIKILDLKRLQRIK